MTRYHQCTFAMRRGLAVVLAWFVMYTPSADSESKPAQFPDVQQLQHMASRFAPTPLAVDMSQLSSGDRRALAKLVQAGRVVDDIFLQQIWSGNRALLHQLRQDSTPLGRARFRLF